MTYNGSAILFDLQVIGSLNYAVFDGLTGNYQINFMPN